MSAARLAETLFRARDGRATGYVTCEAGGLVTRLGLEGGDVACLELAYGFQTPLQALLQAGRLTLRQVDALWARGEARVLDEETLAELGVLQGDVARAQAEAAVRRVAHLVERVSFAPGASVAPTSELRLDGARAVRAAFEADATLEGRGRFRLVPRAPVEPWTRDEAERTWLERYREVGDLEGLDAAQRALLATLALAGAGTLEIDGRSPAGFV